MIARFTLSIKCSGFAFDDETGAVTHESAAPELARILRDNAKLIAAAPDLLAAIEAMRVAGGAAEFQAAFDKAKKLAMEHNVVGKFTMKIQEED